MAIKVCSRCSAPLEPHTLDNVGVEESPLALKVRGMPVLQCAKGHKSPVHRDFMLWMIQQLREREGKIPAAEEKGMVFKKHHCSCGKELAGKPEARKAFAFDLAYEGAPSFKAELELPVYKCPTCGKEQIASQKALHGAVAPAMASLNDAAGFPHSG
jgi:hypothetical protein